MDFKKMKELNYFYFEFKDDILKMLSNKNIDDLYIYDKKYKKNISIRTLYIRDRLYSNYILYYEMITKKDSQITLKTISEIEELASDYSRVCNASYSETLLDSLFKVFEFEVIGKGIKKEYPFLKELSKEITFKK